MGDCIALFMGQGSDTNALNILGCGVGGFEELPTLH